jgi:hypothetical protein
MRYSSHAEPDDVIFETRQGLFHADMPVHRVERVAELYAQYPAPSVWHVRVEPK